jgi:hypothetical protein
MDNNNTDKTTKNITSLEEIKQIIKSKDVSYASHFRVLSLNKNVPFNEINTSQQKRLAKSIIDSEVYKTEFIFTLRNILKENCQDDTINVDDLTVIDKLLLAVSLRIKSIGNIITVELPQEKKGNIKVDLNLVDIYNNALSVIKNIEPKTYEDNYFIIKCSIPTIGVEYGLENELRKDSSAIDIENVDELRQTIGEAFINDIVKYVSEVSMKTDDGVISIDWLSFNFKDRIKIIETFKTGLLKNIMDYISEVRDEIDKIELVNFKIGDVQHSRRLAIDGNFFMIS